MKILEKPFAGIPAGARLLISSPKDIEAFIRTIPSHHHVSPAELRHALAKRDKADATCPVSTGIFLRIVAEAALEQFASGVPAQDLVPFWRVLGPDAPLASKLSVDAQQIEHIKRLAGE